MLGVDPDVLGSRLVDEPAECPDDSHGVHLLRAAFNAVFSTLVLRTAYGPAFAAPDTDDEAFLDTLTTMVRRYSFRR